jgi:glycosyltransferase involved in cell wall biosynthesis
MMRGASDGLNNSPGSVQLSIVTVTFRNDDGLRRTLESLVNLGHTTREVIVVDGASLPTTKSLVTSLVPDATVVQEPDDGPYDAMNKGALLAKGQWVWFLNAGDTVAPDVTPDMLQRLIAAAGSAVVVARALRPSGAPWPSDRSATMSGYQSPCHQAILTPRHLLHRPAFDRHLKLAADYDAFLRCARGSQVHFSDEAICTYEGGGMSSRRRLRLEVELFFLRIRYDLEGLRRIPGDLLRIPWRALRSWRAARRAAA